MTSRPQYPMDSGVSVFGTQDSGPDGEQGERDVAGSPPAPVPADHAEARRAMLAYLGVPFTLCLVPLAVYPTSLDGRRVEADPRRGPQLRQPGIGTARPGRGTD